MATALVSNMFTVFDELWGCGGIEFCGRGMECVKYRFSLW